MSCLILLQCCIDRRLYLNLSKWTQSATGLKALKPAADGRPSCIIIQGKPELIETLKQTDRLNDRLIYLIKSVLGLSVGIISRR